MEKNTDIHMETAVKIQGCMGVSGSEKTGQSSGKT